MFNSINWNHCIICQKLTTEELRCTTKCALDRSPADCLMLFLYNVEAFRDLGALPVNLNCGGHGTAKKLVQNNTS